MAEVVGYLQGLWSSGLITQPADVSQNPVVGWVTTCIEPVHVVDMCRSIHAHGHFQIGLLLQELEKAVIDDRAVAREADVRHAAQHTFINQRFRLGTDSFNAGQVQGWFAAK